MDTLYELKQALYSISGKLSSDWIPVTVDGKKIESVRLTDDYRIEIKLKKRCGGIIMYVARDANGDLWLYKEKPTKGNKSWENNGSENQVMLFDWFPEVSWEDEEPRELVLKPINKE